MLVYKGVYIKTKQEKVKGLFASAEKDIYDRPVEDILIESVELEE